MRVPTNGLTYAEAGVDIDAGSALVAAIRPLARKTRRPGASAELGGFGAAFDLRAAGFTDPVLIASTDGVGTKVKLAIEAGNSSTIGIDLVAMVVNDLVVQGAEPLFFLDYFACGVLDVEEGARIIAGIAEGCKMAGAALIGGETAEMPGLYQGRDYDLAGFAVGAAERGALLPRASAIEPGDAVLGLSSSGVHSNGFSLVRKIIPLSGLSLGDAAPFAAGQTLGDALLAPTRIYVRPLLSLLRGEYGGKVRALAHITGGGMTENIPRVLPEQGLGVAIDLRALALPPVFAWLAKLGGVAEAELLRVFNCGIGMVVIVARDAAAEISAELERAGEQVARLGEVIPQAEGAPRVHYSGGLLAQ